MHRACVLVVCAAGCGRIAFDPFGDGGDGGGDGTVVDAPALPLCLTDDFDDGDADGWQNVGGDWAVQSAGSGQSPMLHHEAVTSVGLTHPSLRRVSRAQIELDLRMEAQADGDFFVHFLEPGWSSAANDTKYRVALHPIGSDNATDDLRRVVAPINTRLAETATILTTDSWHRVEVTLGDNNAMRVTIDGAVHLQSGPDGEIEPPFDVVFAFYKAGAIDNVRVGCIAIQD